MATPTSSDDREVHSTSGEFRDDQHIDRIGEFPSFLSCLLKLGSGKGLNYVPAKTESNLKPWSPNTPSNDSSDRLFRPVAVSLDDSDDLWGQFSKVGTEMIIAKPGRLMFPTVRVKLENLDPYRYYKVFLEFAPVDFFRYKFERNQWWMPKLTERFKSPDWLPHPMSPALGQRWMERPVDFQVKLTNCWDRVQEGMVCLQSMHKYMLKVHVVEGSDATQRDPLLTRSFPLAKTTFMAVTTYQNPKIRELKTEKNVHAKGIRHKKMKLHYGDLEDTKENNPICSKKHRPDMPPSFSSFALAERNESPLHSQQPHHQPEPTSSPVTSTCPVGTTCCNETDSRTAFTSPAAFNPYTSPSAYSCNSPPPFDLRMPLSCPLPVPCPPPHYYPPYMPYPTVHPAYPFPPMQPSGMALHNWSVYPGYGCSSLRVCPGYRTPCSTRSSSGSGGECVPSSTTDLLERPSTSSDDSPTWSDFTGLRQYVRESRCSYGDESGLSPVSSDCEADSPAAVDRGGDVDHSRSTVERNDADGCFRLW